MNIKPRPTKEQLEKDYKNVPVGVVCLKYDITPATLYSWLRDMDIPNKGYTEGISFQEKWEYVKKFTKENGYPPSSNEISIAFGLALQTAKQFLHVMNLKGKINRGHFHHTVMKPVSIYRSYELREEMK